MTKEFRTTDEAGLNLRMPMISIRLNAKLKMWSSANATLLVVAQLEMSLAARARRGAITQKSPNLSKELKVLTTAQVKMTSP